MAEQEAAKHGQSNLSIVGQYDQLLAHIRSAGSCSLHSVILLLAKSFPTNKSRNGVGIVEILAKYFPYISGEL